MLIVMRNNANASNIQAVCETIRALGLQAKPMPGAERSAIGITGNTSPIDAKHFLNLPGVLEAIPISKPYKLASLEFHPERTRITINGHTIGQDFTLIAGPCSVEAEPTMFRLAERLSDMGVTFFRAGAYKPRSSPYSFQGMGQAGLDILAKIKHQFGMAIVTEVMDVDTLPAIIDVADIVQIGTRNMANTGLLKAVGKTQTPVLLKRGMAATLEELLLAAEYILNEGNEQVILCERGIRTFGDHTRNTLDIGAIPALKTLSHLPILVDPSHAAGVSTYIPALSLAATAAGANGLMIEVHDDACNAYSDGQQALHPTQLQTLIQQINDLTHFVKLD